MFRFLWMTPGYTSVTTRSAVETPQDTPGQHRDASGRLMDTPDGSVNMDRHNRNLVQLQLLLLEMERQLLIISAMIDRLRSR